MYYHLQIHFTTLSNQNGILLQTLTCKSVILCIGHSVKFCTSTNRWCSSFEFRVLNSSFFRFGDFWCRLPRTGLLLLFRPGVELWELLLFPRGTAEERGSNKSFISWSSQISKHDIVTSTAAVSSDGWEVRPRMERTTFPTRPAPTSTLVKCCSFFLELECDEFEVGPNSVRVLPLPWLP